MKHTKVFNRKNAQVPHVWYDTRRGLLDYFFLLLTSLAATPFVFAQETATAGNGTNSFSQFGYPGRGVTNSNGISTPSRVGSRVTSNLAGEASKAGLPGGLTGVQTGPGGFGGGNRSAAMPQSLENAGQAFEVRPNSADSQTNSLGNGSLLPRGQSSTSSLPGANETRPSEPPSEFQVFVQQATGQALPVYGSQLFLNSRFDAVQGNRVSAGYVVGPGDELDIQVYGAVDYTDRLVVDRDGRITIPRVGPIRVAGLRFGELEASLLRSLGEFYRNFKLSVTMGRLRSIEIYVLGQARSPGRKVVSSLSTIINALFETGGPSSRGSMRGVELRREGRVIAKIDLYDFISRGDSSADRTLEPGDIIFIPPVGPQIALAGSVNEPAIYELRREDVSLKSMLALSGGLPTLASPQRATLERINPVQQPARFIKEIALDELGLGTALQAGDIVMLFQISPQFANAVTLQGNVAAPMRYAYREGMRISDLVSNNNFLVPVSYWLRYNAGQNIAGLDKPEVNLHYATVQRLNPSSVRTEVLTFNLAKAILGDLKENLELKPGDLVRVYGAEEPGIDALESVSLEASFIDGSTRFPWREGHRVTDVIPDVHWLNERVVRWIRRAGGPTVSIFGTRKSDLNAVRQIDVDKTTSTTKKSALNAARRIDADETISTQIGQVTTGSTFNQSGQEVSNPPLASAEVQEINLDYADIKRIDPRTMAVQLISFSLAKAIAGDVDHNIELRPGDRIGVYNKAEVPVPISQRTRLVKVLGEVKVPGVYQVMPGETLTDIVNRAGGLTPDAYVFGSVFTRESTKTSQQNELDRLVRKLESGLMSKGDLALATASSTEIVQSKANVEIEKRIIERLKTLQPIGRISLDLDVKTKNPSLPNLGLENGDILTIPSRPDFISVIGSVDSESAFTYRPGDRVKDYLNRAGLSSSSDVDNVTVQKADGSFRSANSVNTKTRIFSLSDDSILNLVVDRGDSIFVPSQIDQRSSYIKFVSGAKDWTQLLYQLGLGAAAIRVFRQ
jgi:protein involved in polysaccharide export with SLBB domain